jgi:hypothetical protein
MAFSGFLFGMIAGLVTAGISYFALSLPLWTCLLIYSGAGAFGTLSVICIGYVLQDHRSDCSPAEDQRTVVG